MKKINKIVIFLYSRRLVKNFYIQLTNIHTYIRIGAIYFELGLRNLVHLIVNEMEKIISLRSNIVL